MNKTAKTNRYKVVMHTIPTIDHPYYKYGEMVREAFNGIVRNLFDYIEIRNSMFGGVEVSLDGSDHCFDDSVKFLSKGVFSYSVKPHDKEPWFLYIPCEYISVTAENPTLCVLAAIREKSKGLAIEQNYLKKFKKTENYTKIIGGEC